MKIDNDIHFRDCEVQADDRLMTGEYGPSPSANTNDAARRKFFGTVVMLLC